MLADTNINLLEIILKNLLNLNIKIINTGTNTMTGGRIKFLKKHINNERFMLTYGDGVCNVNLKKLLNFHKKINISLR